MSRSRDLRVPINNSLALTPINSAVGTTLSAAATFLATYSSDGQGFVMTFTAGDA